MFFRPTFHAKWPKPIFGDFNGFPPILVDFQLISIDFLSFSISLSQFQSVLISFNQFQSVWLGQKRRNLLTTGRWGKQHLKYGQKLLIFLSGPLRLRVQSRSRTQLRIAASIAFLFRACFKGVWGHYSTTIARLNPESGLERGGRELPPVRGCEIARDSASQSRSLLQRGSYSGRGSEAEIV